LNEKVLPHTQMKVKIDQRKYPSRGTAVLERMIDKVIDIGYRNYGSCIDFLFPTGCKLGEISHGTPSQNE
jgi:hypothetical protein